MELIAKGSFYRDLIKHSDSYTLKEISLVFQNISAANKISQINQLKKLREYKVCYRIRVANDYRLGVAIRGNKVWIIRFCHRSVFYKRFP